jgi:nucleoside-diphosphate-sugar epimerase
MQLKVLFIGGTGIISSACSQRAIEMGMDLHLFNRGKSPRPAPDGANVLIGDINHEDSVKETILKDDFDVVVNWIAFTPEEVQRDINLFANRTGQYIFISSASAYQKPVPELPITEKTPLENPFWDYSRAKSACEDLLTLAYLQNGFPATIVRPSHTYDKTLLPFQGGFTNIDRMRKGKKVIIHGDGTSLWTLTHHKDFAIGFNGLLGNNKAIGEIYHITSDEILTWNKIFEILANAAGEELHPVHIPSDFIAHYDPDWGAGLLGDKAHSVIFDNTKIKNLVPEFKAEIPFSQGAEEIIGWYDQDPARQVVDESFSRLVDTMIFRFENAMR